MDTRKKSQFLVVLMFLALSSFAQIDPKKEWWLEEPYRLIQTNLREIDAKDFDVDVFVNSFKDIGANTVLINVGGIVANYYTDLEFHYQNPFLKSDMIKDVVNRLHQEGIRVMGRFDFSKLNETLAVKKPEWLYKNLKGEEVNYNQQVHTCIIRKYQQFKSETSDELFHRIHDLIKSFGDHIAICTYTAAGTDFYRKESNSHGAIYNDLPRELESYQVVVLPDISRLSEGQCAKLDKYVENGGKLLATGFTSVKDENGNPIGKIRLSSLGVNPEYKTFTKEQGTYFRIFERDKKRLANEIFNNLDLVYAWEEGLFCKPKAGAEGLLGYIPPAMIGPPEKTYYTEVTEIPGLIFTNSGKGKTAFFPFRIGTLYHHTRHYGHAALVMNTLTNLLAYQPDIVTKASPLVEISRQKSKDGSFEWYGQLNHSGQLGNAFHEPIPIFNTAFTITPEKNVKSVRSLKLKESIPYKKLGDGRIEITLPTLESFDVILIEN